jgi:uncharacterized protein (TIGR00369 family)
MLNKQPGSSDCFVCGVNNPFGLKMKFYTTAPGVVETTYTVAEEYQSYPGFVHGGIIACMMDEVMGRVFMPDGSDRFMVTGEIKIRYRKPVPILTPLTLRGRAIKDYGRVARAEGEILDPDGTLLVQGEITVAELPAEMKTESDFDKMGWMVYPD